MYWLVNVTEMNEDGTDQEIKISGKFKWHAYKDASRTFDAVCLAYYEDIESTEIGLTRLAVGRCLTGDRHAMITLTKEKGRP